MTFPRWLIAASFAPTLFAQQPAQPPTWADHSVLESVNSELPKWIQFGGEYRIRWEGFANSGFRPENDDFHLLHRVRLNLTLKPSKWFKVFVQGQDARVWGAELIPHAPPYQDTYDLRQAYVELGGEAQPFTLRTGRQEITFGEERLVGASNWANAARTFDAVRLDLRTRGLRVSSFASSVVVTQEGTFDHHTQANNLHGIFANAERWLPRTKVEPFLFWRLNPRARAETGLTGKLDTRTFGVRLTSALTKRLTFVSEMAMQRGNSSTDRVSAWAGHWRIEQLVGKRYTPKLRAEFNYATGDRDPRDGKVGVFDVLYPTPHDKYGLADQVGWKNVEHAAIIFEMKPVSRLTLQGKFHTWWLAQAADALYNAPGAVLVPRDPTGRSGRHIGEEADIQAIWAAGKNVLLGGGVGHIFTGEFLNNRTPGANYTFPYVMFTYTF